MVIVFEVLPKIQRKKNNTRQLFWIDNWGYYLGFLRSLYNPRKVIHLDLRLATSNCLQKFYPSVVGLVDFDKTYFKDFTFKNLFADMNKSDLHDEEAIKNNLLSLMNLLSLEKDAFFKKVDELSPLEIQKIQIINSLLGSNRNILLFSDHYFIDAISIQEYVDLCQKFEKTVFIAGKYRVFEEIGNCTISLQPESSLQKDEKKIEPKISFNEVSKTQPSNEYQQVLKKSGVILGTKEQIEKINPDIFQRVDRKWSMDTIHKTTLMIIIDKGCSLDTLDLDKLALESNSQNEISVFIGENITSSLIDGCLSSKRSSQGDKCFKLYIEEDSHIDISGFYRDAKGYSKRIRFEIYQKSRSKIQSNVFVVDDLNGNIDFDLKHIDKEASFFLESYSFSQVLPKFGLSVNSSSGLDYNILVKNYQVVLENELSRLTQKEYLPATNRSKYSYRNDSKDLEKPYSDFDLNGLIRYLYSQSFDSQSITNWILTEILDLSFHKVAIEYFVEIQLYIEKKLREIENG